MRGVGGHEEQDWDLLSFIGAQEPCCTPPTRLPIVVETRNCWVTNSFHLP